MWIFVILIDGYLIYYLFLYLDIDVKDKALKFKGGL